MAKTSHIELPTGELFPILYGPPRGRTAVLGLRAIKLAYTDPFTRRKVEISAPTGDFLREFGFDAPASEPS
jgi:hypothetical protein